MRYFVVHNTITRLVSIGAIRNNNFPRWKNRFGKSANAGGYFTELVKDEYHQLQKFIKSKNGRKNYNEIRDMILSLNKRWVD